MYKMKKISILGLNLKVKKIKQNPNCTFTGKCFLLGHGMNFGFQEKYEGKNKNRVFKSLKI